MISIRIDAGGGGDAGTSKSEPEVAVGVIGVEEKSAAYESLVAPQSAPTVPAVKRKVLVIDDELAGPSLSHVPPDLFEAFADINSPAYESLLSVARLMPGFSEIEKGGMRALKEYFAGEGLLTVLFSEGFGVAASDDLKGVTAKFIQDVQRVSYLRSKILGAFDSELYDVEFRGPVRPQVDEVLDLALLMLDLVLHTSGSPVDEAKGYLRDLAVAAGARVLPPIILMSHSPDLSDHQLEFSAESKVSAAGLLVLPKMKLLAEDFGSAGLRLTYGQLEAQSKAAHHMRVFIQAWTSSLERARGEAEKTLWNLDAPAMQQIHQTALSDNDPYDEHLNELIVREYIWHVESDRAVSDAVSALDAEFLSSFEAGKLTRRFGSAFFDPAHARVLIGRYTWTGWPEPDPFVGAATGMINKLLPFGAIVIPGECADGKECFIHVTQQCDLNGISRTPDNGRSLTFVTVKAVEIFKDKVEYYDNDDLVARGLFLDTGCEFDFVLQPGRMLAMTVEQLNEFGRSQDLKVRGRLRHEIAAQFLQAAVNNLTRAASQKMARAALGKAKITLHGAKLDDKKFMPWLGNSSTASIVVPSGAGTKKPQPSAKVFDVVVEEGPIVLFPISVAFDIALWIMRTVEGAYPDVKVDANAVCDALLLGVSSISGIVPGLDATIHQVELSQAFKVINGLNVGPRIELAIFVEKVTGRLAVSGPVAASKPWSSVAVASAPAGTASD